MTRLAFGIMVAGCAGGTDEPAPGAHPSPAPAVCADAEVPYDGVDNDCDPGSPDDDLDGDGRVGPDDCDDTDPGVGGPEVPYDDVDNDCDPDTRDDDVDGDGFVLANDCDDANEQVWEPQGSVGHDVVGADVAAVCHVYCSLTIEGDLGVEGDRDRADLSDLWCVEAVEGSVRIATNPTLATLAGLEHLTRAGSLLIADNPSLQDLDALGSLSEVGGGFQLTSNAALADITGLAALTRVDGSLILGWNDPLTSVAGLENLETVAGMLHVYHLPRITDLGALSNLGEVAGLEIDDDPELVSLSGLDGLTRIDGPLILDENTALVDASALYAVVEVSGDVVITHNTTLGQAAAEQLVDEIDAIGGTVTLDDNG